MQKQVIKFTNRSPYPNSIFIGNEDDNLARQVQFVLPSEIDGAKIYLHLSIGEYSDVIELDDSLIYVPTRTHTQYPGNWTGYLEAHADNDTVWHSNTFTFKVGDLPDSEEQIEQAYPSAIEEALRAVDTLTGVGARAVTLEPGSDATVSFEEDSSGKRTIIYGIPRGADGSGGGSDGATFTPSVSDEGVISWTNDKDLPNPDPVDIKGDTGPAGADGVGIQSVEQTTTSTEDGGTNVITVTKTDGTSSTFSVRNGSKGSTGPAGADGQDGATPTIGDNGNWYIGDTDTGKPSRGEIGPAGADGKSAYQYAQDGGYTGTQEEFAAKLAEDHIPVPATAEVGQTIVVKAVDESGKPTEWETADMAGVGGGSEWTKLGDITVNESYEFIPLSFTGGVVTIDTSAEGYEYLTSNARVLCVVVPINIMTKVDNIAGQLRVTDATAGTFDFYNRDGAAQTSASYDPATYKIVVLNVVDVVMKNVPTTYDRYKLRVTTPVISTHGLRSFFTSTISGLGLNASAAINSTGGGFVEIELLTIPGNTNYMYRSVFIAYGKLYGGGSNNEFRAFDIVQAGTGLTKPPANGTVTFTATNMIFVNGTRFELWGANDD